MSLSPPRRQVLVERWRKYGRTPEAHHPARAKSHGRRPRSSHPAAAALMLAPGEAPGTPEVLVYDSIRATLDRALEHLRGIVVKRHVTAKFTVGHCKYDVANRPAIAGGDRHAQQRADRGMAADQQTGRKEHEK